MYGHTLLKVESAFGYDEVRLGFVGIFQRGAAIRSRIQFIAKEPSQHPAMKSTLSISIAFLTFLGITKASPTDTNGPQVLIEAKFIEVGDAAKDLLEPFGTSSESQTIAGPLNDDQRRTLWKELEITKGVDVLSTPRVNLRAGQRSKIQIAHEFAYKDASGKPAKKQLGATLSIKATKFEGNNFDLEVSPEIVELEGMTKVNSGEDQPQFKEHRATFQTIMAMASGETVVFGLPAISKKQITKERSAGRVTTKTEHVTRHTMVFVTARLLDSATGKPLDPKLRN